MWKWNRGKARYRILDMDKLMAFMGVSCLSQLQEACQWQVETALAQRQLARQSRWTESITVGRPEYVESLRKQLGIQGKGRDMRPMEEGCQLRETETAYRGVFPVKKGSLSFENLLFWNKSFYISMP
jgi:hypothetical protein